MGCIFVGVRYAPALSAIVLAAAALSAIAVAEDEPILLTGLSPPHGRPSRPTPHSLRMERFVFKSGRWLTQTLGQIAIPKFQKSLQSYEALNCNIAAKMNLSAAFRRSPVVTEF